MNDKLNLSPKPSHPRSSSKPTENHREKSNMRDEAIDNIIDTIRKLDSLKSYPIRDLVQHSESFGKLLKAKKLETNQIRKFLDAIKQAKFKITRLKGGAVKSSNFEKDKLQTINQEIFKEIESDIVMLKPKLAYAAARQEAAKPLNEVISVAIDKTRSIEDFNRLVQLIESIIAYHKS